MPSRPTSRTTLLATSTLSMWLVWAADFVWPGTIGHGIVPRTAYGISGIVMAPFIHANLQHLLANTIPFILLGAVILLRGARAFLFVAVVSAIVSGAGTWLFGRPNTHHIGASGVVFGFFGYLLLRAVYDRRISSALIAVAVVVVYGAAFLTSLMPASGISWTGHVFGFIGGGVSARLRYGRPLAALAAVLLFSACTSIEGPSYDIHRASPEAPALDFVESGDVRILARGGSSFETSVAVSPQIPAQTVVGVIAQARKGCDFYTSHDGGLSWTGGAMPQKASNGRIYAGGQGDPVVVADRLGIFHYSLLMVSGNPAKFTAVATSRSIDGGLTWSDPLLVAELEVKDGAEREFDDKQWLAADATGGRFDGNLYLLWNRLRQAALPYESRMMFSRSTDRGLSWSEPVALTDLAPSGQSMVEIGPEGEVYLAYGIHGEHVLRVSRDGGATFGEPVRIPLLPPIGGIIPNTRYAQFKSFPTLLCDRSSGNLYVVMATPALNLAGRRVGGVALKRSVDGGRTWSEPRMISTPTTGDAIFPSGAIDPSTGELVIAWLDRRDDPANALARLYATRSRDGGVTFERPRGFTPPFSIDAAWIGDYYGVAGRDGNWIATFSPASGQMSVVKLRFDEELPAPRRRAVRR